MGLRLGVAAQPLPPPQLTVGNAVQSEADGYDSIWYPDHLMGWFARSMWTPENSSIVNVLPSPHLYLDTTITMALVAQSTSKIEIGSGVTDPIRRTPAELARTFRTLSHVSDGRTILGIGAGEKENIVPYGMNFSYQVSKLEEALQIIRALWSSDDYVNFDGRFWKLKKAVLDLPAYDGKDPKIWVGAHGPRMLEITGKYADGWYPSYPMKPADYAAKLKVVRDAAAAAGRDPAAIEAGYQMYAAVVDDHETAHEIMQMPLARGLALAGSSEMWEKAGLSHPLGKDFDGLRDYVPEWYTPEELEEAMSHFDIDVVHDVVVHGTVDEVTSKITPFIDAGMEHLVMGNTSSLGGLEYLDMARRNMLELKNNLQ